MRDNKMVNKCNNCQAYSNGCIVNQSPDNCSYYEYQKDVDILAEQNGNTIIMNDNKKNYRRQIKREKKNTILSNDSGKYRVKE